MTTSVGGSWAVQMDDFHRALGAADGALYAAKAAGRNAVVFAAAMPPAAALAA